MAAAANDFKAIAAQKHLLPDSKYRNIPLENALFDCPRLECREPEDPGHLDFLQPGKTLPFSSSDVQTSNLMLRRNHFSSSRRLGVVCRALGGRPRQRF